MSTLVRTLAVDVGNGQATFTLHDAKSELDSFGRNVPDTQVQVDYSMGEARHSVMMLGEEMGVHLPRGVTTFIASLGPVGAALEAAFPFLAIIVGATQLIEHLTKLREEGDKLGNAQQSFGTTVQTVFNNLDDKLLEAGIRADELAGNHLAALSNQLQLIDHASMKDLAQQFDIIAKSADAVFAQIKEHWYNIGTVETGGAKNALTQFKAQYDSLLAQGKDEEAHGLLTGTLKQAKEFYDRMYAQQEGHGSSEKELAAQQTLLDALNAQLVVEQKISALKNAQDTEVVQKTSNEV